MNQNYKYMRTLILKYTWPAIIEFALQTVGSYVNYIMVGRLGIQASAIVGLNVEINFLVRGVNIAISIGILVYIANAIGEGDFTKAKKGAKQGLLTAILVGMIEFMLMMAICPLLPNWLGAEKSLQNNAIQYFFIIYSSIFFIALNIIAGSILKAVGDMKTPMYVNVIVNIVNIILNFLLIYQSNTFHIGKYTMHLPGANLNINGAAIATSVSAVLGGILMVVGLYRNKTISPGRLSIRFDIHIMKRFMQVGIPVLFSRVTTSFGRIIFTTFLAGLGTTAFAAHSTAFTAESAFYIPVIGFQAAVTTIASITAGERNQEKLNFLTKETVKMASFSMLIMGTILFLFSKEIMQLFTRNMEVITVGSRLLKIVSINEPLFAAYVVLEGVFNGVGETKIPLKISICSLWMIRVCGTLICLKILHLGIYAAWICMISDNIFRCLILIYKYKNLRVKNIFHNFP